MRKFVLAIYTRLLPVYVCPCGHKARGRKAAMQHLATHPTGIGSIDYGTGAIAW